MHKPILLAASIILLLAGTKFPILFPDQLKSRWPQVVEPPLQSQVQNAGMLEWLIPKKKSEPRQAPVQKPIEKRQSHKSQTASGTYRTLCVRTCNGYCFSIRHKVARSKFGNANEACIQRRAVGEARPFVHRNPVQEVASAVDLEGNRYINLENAFRYRKEPVDGCGC